MSTSVECPVCKMKLEAKTADSHVNSCLDTSSKDIPVVKRSVKRPNEWNFMNSPQTKRRLIKDSASKEDDTNLKSKTSIQDIKEKNESNFKNKNHHNDIHSNRASQNIKKINLSNKHTNSNKTPNRMEIPSDDIMMSRREFSVPLAEVVRPQRVEDMIGQAVALGKGSALRRLIEACKFTSLILWGPPGCGKTTLARVIEHSCNQQCKQWRFMKLSATTAGTADVKSCIEAARNDKRLMKRRTVLFIDEIHRFNKSQQDTLLACIEDGTIVFIGATTENPSFQVNNALLSRCKVVVLEKLSTEAIRSILLRSMERFHCFLSDDGCSEDKTKCGNNREVSRDIASSSNAENKKNKNQDCKNVEDKFKKSNEIRETEDGNEKCNEEDCGKYNIKEVEIKEKIKEKDEDNTIKLDEDINREIKSDTFQMGNIQTGNRWMLEEKGLDLLVDCCDGDARKALNSLQSLLELKMAARDGGDGDDGGWSGGDDEDGSKGGINSGNSDKHLGVCRDTFKTLITLDDVRSIVLRSVQYDRKGEEHYNAASALQKSIRGSDDNGAIYWLARMLEGGEDPLFVARRLVVCASEDIGLTDPQALPLAVATYQACHFIGMPECSINLAHCAAYLARCNKSNESYAALKKARECIRDHKGALPGVPLHLRNAPTKLMKNLGYHKGYKYNHAFDEPVQQTYLPDSMLGVDFFERR